jgi:hypothetical protein
MALLFTSFVVAAAATIDLQAIETTPSHAAGGDVDGDGLRDLVVGKELVADAPGVFVFLGTPTGLSTEPAVTIGPRDDVIPYSPWEIALGDLDGDGDDDLVLALVESPLEIYLGGPGGFGATPDLLIVLPESTFELHPAVVDVDADGFADVVVGMPGLRQVWLVRSTASGPWSPPELVLSPPEQDEALAGAALRAAGDVDGDGFQDVAFSSLSSVWLCRGSVDGLTEAGCSSTAVDVVQAPVAPAGDVDGDCFADAVWSGTTVLRGSAAGFDAPWALPEAPSASGVGDVDGDGYDEIALGYVSATSTPAFTLHRGGPDGPSETADLTFGELSTGYAERMPTLVSMVGDLDGDGLADVFASPSTVVTGLTFTDAAAWPAPDACPEPAEVMGGDAHSAACGCAASGAANPWWAAAASVAVALARRNRARLTCGGRSTGPSTGRAGVSPERHPSRVEVRPCPPVRGATGRGALERHGRR